jgi:endonuclease/exonuclease/phosphatase family metal-dependent hydrolase
MLSFPTFEAAKDLSMKLFKHILLAVGAFLAFSSASNAQTDIRVMSYNLLNFPQGSMTNRVDTLKKIVDYYEPDLFLVQELKSESGLTLATDACNEMLDNEYTHGTFLPQQSNPGTSWPLQQNLVYNTEMFTLKSQDFVQTFVRDINEFVLYLNDENLDNGADTTFINVYVAHLKSSQGNDNEESRASMAQYFVDHLNSLPSNTHVLLGGDFNLYTSSEEAYQILLDDASNIVLQDPIDSPGNWHSSSFPNKEILTQSTRSSQIFGDGAGGGLDDRFDFVLLSESLMNPTSTIHYADETYRALGNNGECYNSDLLDCMGGNLVPESLIRAMYYMSDHLPVVLELTADVSIGVDESTLQNSEINITFNNNQNSVLVRSDKSIEQPLVQIFDLSGRLIESHQLDALIEGQSRTVNLKNSPAGFYIIRVVGEDTQITKRIVRQ